MVNENTAKFLKEQRKAEYLEGGNGRRVKSNAAYNNRNNTDISIGAAGRDVFKDQ